MSKLKDLTGQRFGRLVVKYICPERKNGRVYWHCQCDCGVEKDVQTSNLTGGRTLSCGCLSQEKRLARSINNYIGKRFYRLTVIDKTDKRGTDGSIIWKCLCDCGNICEVSTNYLRNGEKKSCGCKTREDMKNSQQTKYDLTNQRFGKILVIHRDFESAKWFCRCDCGQTLLVRTNQLISENGIQSCGKCTHISKGEEKINNLLTQHNIPFERQKTFETCINPKTQKLLKFDFFVDNRYLIEYDGEQHFQEIEIFRDSLAEIQYRDNIKNQWCKENNIPLIRISYTQFDSFDFDDIYLHKNKESEYYEKI